jgi:MHS family proline/betaine transporter-like MFS transporter
MWNHYNPGSMQTTTTNRGTRAILAASLGNLLEWFDFAVYAAFAIYIGKNFFPGDSPAAGLVSAFLVFGFGFVIRPLGAVLIGIYGDRAGRKAALTATILIMACGTLIIATAPTYAAIGLGAPLVLLTGRMLQGFSAGGEIGSATAFLVEHAPARRRALFTAWLQASMGMSNIMGALTAFTITSLMRESEIDRWGWRVPFFIGLAIVPLGVYLRRTLEETPAFRAEAAIERGARQPLRRVFRDHTPELAAGFGVSILWAAEVYVLLIFMPVFLQKALGFTPVQAFGSSLAENVVFVIGCFLFGALADRVGHARIQAYGAALVLITILPLFVWVDHARSMGVLIVMVCTCGVLAASFCGVAPTTLSGMFPTPVRATGVSLAYNAGFTLFGGFAPAILSRYLQARSGTAAYAPAGFIMLAAIPALIALKFEARHRAATALADPESG